MAEREVTDEELKAAVKELTPAGTQEIADHVGLTRQAVDYRLQKIEDRYSDPMCMVEDDRADEGVAPR